MSILELFFAVTTTSIYEVMARDAQGFPCARKIALKGESIIPLGKIITDQMLAICDGLQFYTPEGHGFLSSQTSVERRVEMVNAQWYGPNSSHIIALFFTEKEARKCFSAKNLKPCDPRWLEKTKAVIAAIGEDHPTITICHEQGMAFLAR
jgi:hypothetical protein